MDAEKSNTHRTDAFEKQRIVEATTNEIATEAWADFARQLERENERLREALRQCKGAIYGYASTNPLALDSVLWRAHDSAVVALAAQPKEKTK